MNSCVKSALHRHVKSQYKCELKKLKEILIMGENCEHELVAESATNYFEGH